MESVFFLLYSLLQFLSTASFTQLSYIFFFIVLLSCISFRKFCLTPHFLVLYTLSLCFLLTLYPLFMFYLSTIFSQYFFLLSLHIFLCHYVILYHLFSCIQSCFNVMSFLLLYFSTSFKYTFVVLSFVSFFHRVFRSSSHYFGYVPYQ